MKANGKNLKMFMYQTHDYMDMHPETNFRTAESLDVMNEILEDFKANWHSGTVSAPKEVSPKEYFQARQSRYWKGYEEELDALACDCTEEWLKEYQSYIESNNNK